MRIKSLFRYAEKDFNSSIKKKKKYIYYNALKGETQSCG